jgi:hypothetical protein
VSYKVSLLGFQDHFGGKAGMYSEAPANNQDYRQEARSIRAKAREVHDTAARAQLFLIASLYDKLANLLNDLAPTLQGKLTRHSLPEEPTKGTDSA